MKPGQSIHIQLLDETGAPLPAENIIVHIEFFTNGNYRYGFEAGRTDKKGRLVVSYDELEHRRLSLSSEFLMDYNTKLDECDPIIKIVILSEEELRSRQRKVLRFYGTEPDWAKAWPSNARIKAESKTVDLANQVTTVDIPARGA